MSSTRSAARPVRRTTAARRPPARRPAAKRRPPARRGSRGTPTGSWRSWLPLGLVGLVVLGVVALARNTEGPESTALCTVPHTSVTLTAEQLENARTIAAVAEERGLPERAVVIALATAMQESTLRNLDYGDRDSLGLFQQRPSQGWGSPEQVQDPVYAAGEFYDGLVQVPGWESGELTRVADAVQRSAYPLAYAKWSGFAESLAATMRSDAGPEQICG